MSSRSRQWQWSRMNPFCHIPWKIVSKTLYHFYLNHRGVERICFAEFVLRVSMRQETFPYSINWGFWQIRLTRFFERFSAWFKTISPLHFQGKLMNRLAGFRRRFSARLHDSSPRAASCVTLLNWLPIAIQTQGWYHCLSNTLYNLQPAEHMIIWFPESQRHVRGHMCFPSKSATDCRMNTRPVL